MLLELFVVRGISEEDYINETGDFGGYMMYLDTYLAMRESDMFLISGAGSSCIKGW